MKILTNERYYEILLIKHEEQILQEYIAILKQEIEQLKKESDAIQKECNKYKKIIKEGIYVNPNITHISA